MKDWIRRWLGIAPQKTLSHDLAADLIGEAFKKLEAAQQQHISDLRVLIDKGLEREAQLSKMVEMVVENHYFRPKVTGKTPENKILLTLPPEQLTDVAVFDEKDDRAQIEEQNQREKELTNELARLTSEQNQEGITKVGA